MAEEGKWIVVHTCSNPPSGVFTVIHQLCSWMKEQDNLIPAVFAYVHKDWPEGYHEQLDRLDIPYRLPKAWFPRVRSWYLILALRKGLARYIEELDRTYQPERIIVHFHDAFLSGTQQPVRVKTKCDVNVVTTYHGIADRYAKSSIRMGIYRQLAARTCRYSHLVSVDQRGPEIAERIYPVHSKDFHVVNNGVPVTRVRGCPYARPGADGLTVAFIHKMEPRKRWDIAAKAVSLLRARQQNVRIIFAGRGPQSEEIRKWCEEHGSFARFVGFVPDVIEKLMPQVDVILLPSLFEGLPMTILEGMSCGIPTIATPVGGIPEAVIDGHTGFLVDTEDQGTEMADRLQQLIEDPSLLGAMSRHCVERFQERFSIEQCGRRYCEIYGMEAKSPA